MGTVEKFMFLMSRLFVCASFLLLSLNAVAAPAKLIPNNQWQMVSIPADSSNSPTVGELFGDDLPVSGYGTIWVIYGWNPPTETSPGAYYLPLLNQSFTSGRGFWILQRTGTDVWIDVPDSTPAVTLAPEVGCASVGGCDNTSLSTHPDHGAWNMVGYNQDLPFEFDQARFVFGAGRCETGCSLATAAKSPALIAPNPWRYVGPAIGYEAITESSVLQPWDAFWLYTYPAAHSGSSESRLLLSSTKQVPSEPQMSGYEPIFIEDFTAPLSSDKWNSGLLWGPYLPINSEEQFYVDSMGLHEGFAYDPFLITEEGTLKITAVESTASLQPPLRPDEDDPVWRDYLEYRFNPDYNPDEVNYLSGILTSYETFRFSHGYVEARAKVPAGAGLWPALWLLPVHYVERIPEIDIMEFLGQNRNEVHHTYHYFLPEQDWKAVSTPTYKTIGPDFSADFHTYGVAWEPGQIIWYVDGMETKRITEADYIIAGQSMYLLLNLAVGGSWPGTPTPETAFPAEFEVDYIHVYQKKQSLPVDLDNYQLVFNDEFTGNSLDASKWSTRFVWGPFEVINNEQQYYVDALGADASSDYTPFSLSGGATPDTGLLTITARTAAESGDMPRVQPSKDDQYFVENPVSWFRDDYETPAYTSGIITSRESFRFVNGYAEIRAKVPEGDGLWPAFWLLNMFYVGSTPEIDVMEILGENTSEVHHSYHYRDTNGTLISVSDKTLLPPDTPSFSEDFHTFGVQWTHNSIHWYVDGELAYSVAETAEAYQLMYVLANLAVGGSFNSVPLDPEVIPAELVIDYIRVYQSHDSQ
ncbi:MAG: beta-glucanase (GH16 family) [Candidatus Azotimanducaceae bacterium]|jgi:beta-glucanase (GH16 family)